MSQRSFCRNCVILNSEFESGPSFSSVVNVAILYYAQVRASLLPENQNDFLNPKAFPKS